MRFQRLHGPFSFHNYKKNLLRVLGDFSLHIYPVELEDDGVYQCQASPTNDGQPGLRSRFARLSVLVPPQKPQIAQGEFLVTTEDRELVIECISVAGKPPAEVNFNQFIHKIIFILSLPMKLHANRCIRNFYFSETSNILQIGKCFI